MDTIKSAVALTGVSAHTLRAWERRYGLFSPTRAPSGYRVYDDATIARIKEMNALVGEGMAPREAAAVVARRSPAAPTASGPGDEPIPDPYSDLVEAAADLDADRISRILDERFTSLHDVETVIDRWLMPALGRVGREWAAGRVSVAGEHLVASSVVRRLSAAYEAAGRGAGRPLIIGAPPGVQHELGLLAFAVSARRAGMATMYLGADVPLGAWVEAVDKSQARGVVTSAPRRLDVARVAAVGQRLQTDHPDVPVWVGGRYQHLAPPPCRPLGHDIGEAARRLAAA